MTTAYLLRLGEERLEAYEAFPLVKAAMQAELLKRGDQAAAQRLGKAASCQALTSLAETFLLEAWEEEVPEGTSTLFVGFEGPFLQYLTASPVEALQLASSLAGITHVVSLPFPREIPDEFR